MPEPIRQSAGGLDLSQRFKFSKTVVGSPATNEEAIAGSVTVNEDIESVSAAWVWGAVAWTVGTSGTASTIRIRQTDTSGTIIATTGAITTAAASLRFYDLLGFDAAPVLPGQVYVVTLQVTGGAAESTVSGVSLGVVIV